ncbi:MAG: radical SAM protein, partial [bacterium]
MKNPHLAEEELSTEELISLADQLGDLGVKSVSISGGEPFMRKDLVQFVRALKKKKMWVNVTTNGSLLSEKNRQGLIQAGLDSLTVSIDGTEDVHAMLRGGFSFQEIFSNLKDLALQRERYGNGTLSLNVASTITGENVKSIIELNKALARERPDINHIFESLVSFSEQFGLDREDEKVCRLPVDDTQMGWLLAHLPRGKDRFTYRLMRRYNAGKMSFPSLFHPCLAGLFNIVISETGNVLP